MGLFGRIYARALRKGAVLMPFSIKIPYLNLPLGSQRTTAASTNINKPHLFSTHYALSRGTFRSYTLGYNTKFRIA